VVVPELLPSFWSQLAVGVNALQFSPAPLPLESSLIKHFISSSQWATPEHLAEQAPLNIAIFSDSVVASFIHKEQSIGGQLSKSIMVFMAPSRSPPVQKLELPSQVHSAVLSWHPLHVIVHPSILPQTVWASVQVLSMKSLHTPHEVASEHSFLAHLPEPLLASAIHSQPSSTFFAFAQQSPWVS
jgi:hypothetical protein